MRLVADCIVRAATGGDDDRIEVLAEVERLVQRFPASPR